MTPANATSRSARRQGAPVAMMGMTSAAQRDRDRLLQAVRLAGAALARKAAS